MILARPQKQPEPLYPHRQPTELDGPDSVRVIPPAEAALKKLERAGYRVLISQNSGLDRASAWALPGGRQSIVAFSGWRGSLLEALTDLAGELGVRL